MTLPFAPTGGPGDGIFPFQWIVEATNRSGGTIGQGGVVEFDITNTSTEVDNNTPGSSDADGNNSGFNNFVGCTTLGKTAQGTGDVPTSVYGIVTEEGGIADNSTGSVCLFGIVEATTDGNVTINQVLTCNTSEQLLPVNAPGELMLARSLEADDANSKADVLFNGFGWGMSE